MTAPAGKTFAELVADSKTRIREITADELRAWQAEGRDFTLVDIRELDEFQAGAIRDAVHLGRGVLELKANQVLPDADAEIVLYCGGGNRSALGADVLQEMGYTNLWSLAGGYKGFVANA